MTRSISASTGSCYTAAPTCLRGGMPGVCRNLLLVWLAHRLQTSQEEQRKRARLLSLAVRTLASSLKKDGFKVSFGPVLQHSLNPSVMLLNWVKLYNAVCTPTPIHRLCTQTFSPPQKTNALLGIEPAAPPPSRSPSQDVNPLHQSTTKVNGIGVGGA